MAPSIQFRRGAIADLPGLQAGEPGFTTDTKDFYIGFDGTVENNVFIASRRYWRPESSGLGGGVNMYEDTDFGTNFIGLRAPNNVPSDVTYIFPPSPIENNVLTTQSDGTLSWTDSLQDITLTGDITINGDIESDGNISIGDTFARFNTEVFDLQARIINVGLATNPPSDTTWDLGVLFNYFKSGTRYRSGIFWDDSTGRIGISSNVSVINNEFGTGDGDPVIDTSSVVYAPLVLSELWVSDCAGESVTITCADSERTLENISIDGGFY